MPKMRKPDNYDGENTMIISVHIDDEDTARLEAISILTGRTKSDLCESAISEALLDHYRHRKNDPAKLLKDKS